MQASDTCTACGRNRTSAAASRLAAEVESFRRLADQVATPAMLLWALRSVSSAASWAHDQVVTWSSAEKAATGPARDAAPAAAQERFEGSRPPEAPAHFAAPAAATARARSLAQVQSQVLRLAWRRA